MSRTRHPYREQTADFVETAPVRFFVERPIPCSAARLFEIFEDAEAWTAWAGLASVEWTSPMPITAGTTRTVRLGPVEVDEVFLIWQPEERMSFYFTAGSTGVFRAFVEDYRVKTIDDGHCELRWHMGLELEGLARALGPVLRVAMRLNCRRALDRLAAYVEAQS